MSELEQAIIESAKVIMRDDLLIRVSLLELTIEGELDNERPAFNNLDYLWSNFTITAKYKGESLYEMQPEIVTKDGQIVQYWLAAC